MNARTMTLALLSTALLAASGIPLAAATHSLCHNGESFPDEFTILIIPFLNQDVAVDTGTNNGSYVACVNSTGVVVDIVNAPSGTGLVVDNRLCNGNTAACTVILGTTGVAGGPGTGYSCVAGICAYVWINGTQFAP